METFIELEPVELNETELDVVSGGFSIGGFSVSLMNSRNTNSLNNSGNTSISKSIIIAPQIDIEVAVFGWKQFVSY
jgi:hypothetical protein